jgi:hypothetical protein
MSGMPPGGQSKAPRAKHTWLEMSSVAIAALAFCVAIGQSWVARDTEIQTLRAYVVPKSIKFDLSSVRIEMENSGRTPAQHVKLFYNWEVRQLGQRDRLCTEFEFQEKKDQCGSRDGGSNPSSGYMAPAVPITSGNLLCGNVYLDAEMAQREKVDLILYGRITYDDIFGQERRVTTYCSFISPSGAVYCGCHNEIDPINDR